MPPRERPWRGRYVQVGEQGLEGWVRCAVCERPLTDPQSRARGVGPDCLREHDQEEVHEARELALESDRERWRLNLDGDFRDDELAHIRRSRETVERQRRLTTVTPEQEARWATLQEALKRRERAVQERRQDAS